MLKIAICRSMGMHTGPIRIPMIKFRYGMQSGMTEPQPIRVTSSPSFSPPQDIVIPKGASVPSTPLTVSYTISESELPRRFWRQEIDEDECEYINRGGPA